MAGIQAAEALKLLAGREADLLAGLVTVDLWQGTFEVMDLAGRGALVPGLHRGRYEALRRRPPDAPCCAAATRCRSGPRRAALDLPALAARLRGVGGVTANEYLVRFTADDAELVVFGDGRAIVKGRADVAQARTLYAKYVGM